MILYNFESTSKCFLQCFIITPCCKLLSQTGELLSENISKQHFKAIYYYSVWRRQLLCTHIHQRARNDKSLVLLAGRIFSLSTKISWLKWGINFQSLFSNRCFWVMISNLKRHWVYWGTDVGAWNITIGFLELEGDAPIAVLGKRNFVLPKDFFPKPHWFFRFTVCFFSIMVFFSHFLETGFQQVQGLHIFMLQHYHVSFFISMKTRKNRYVMNWVVLCVCQTWSTDKSRIMSLEKSHLP